MQSYLVLLISAALLMGCAATGDDQIASTSAAETVSTTRRVATNSPLIPPHQRESHWYVDASERVAAARAGSGARNVVLFLGDGMGISTITAARILAGQRAGSSGEENQLSFERFPVTGLIKTYNVNAQTADSAGTMSAIVTGVKTDIGVFGVDEAVTRGNCASGQGRELLSLLDIAELAGKQTGIISTARITHATPAATYAKSVNRDWEDDSSLPEAERLAGCMDIAAQFMGVGARLNEAFGAGASDGIEVALGGGRRHFLPASQFPGRRRDNRNLIEEWQGQYPQGRYVEDAGALSAVKTTPVLGLFDTSHMDYAHARAAQDATQPSLPAMAIKALELLQQSDSGFFLMIEAGRIDHAHHAGNAANALNETIELADAVDAVMQRINPEDTLVMVTADHSHVFTMAGYPRRGNPILGKMVPVGGEDPSLDEDGLPYTTLGYINGRGQRDYGSEPDADVTYRDPPNAGRMDISNIDTTALGYHQEALIPLESETHGGEDVAVYATGPGARAAGGAHEQNLLFHVMLSASGWEREAVQRLSRLNKTD